MSKCLGCGKKLSYWECFATEGEDFCKECYPKRKEIINKLKKEEEKKKEIEDKKKEIEDKKYEENEKKEKEIKRILGKVSNKKTKRLILEKAHNLSQKEKERLINMFDEYNNLETTAWLIFAGILAVAFIFFGGSLIIVGLAFVSKIIFWSSVHSKKEKLINELKNI